MYKKKALAKSKAMKSGIKPKKNCKKLMKK